MHVHLFGGGCHTESVYVAWQSEGQKKMSSAERCLLAGTLGRLLDQTAALLDDDDDDDDDDGPKLWQRKEIRSQTSYLDIGSRVYHTHTHTHVLNHVICTRAGEREDFVRFVCEFWPLVCV